MRALFAWTVVSLLGCAPEPKDDADDTVETAETDDTTETPTDTTPTIDEALDCGTMGDAGGIGGGTALQRVDLDLDRFPHAHCNDGTPGFFYFRPATSAETADKWIIQLQGGGSCDSGEACFERWCSVDTAFGMQGMTATASPVQGIRDGGILNRAMGVQNPLADYNQVFVRYCSSDTWSGTAGDVVLTAPHPVTGEDVTARLFFEGRNIVDAVLTTLRQDGAPALSYTLDGGSTALSDLDDATFVSLAGASGGGAGTIFNADRVGELLREHNTACQAGTCPLEYRVLIDSIFGPTRETLDYTQTPLCTELGLCDYAAHYSSVYSDGDWVMKGSIEEASCATYHAADGELWRCADAGHVVRNHVTTPLFVRMGLADSLISDSYVEPGFAYNGERVDIRLFGNLVAEQLVALTDPANAEEGDAFTVAPGVFGPACPRHETLSDDGSTYETTVNHTTEPTPMFRAIVGWLAGLSPVAVVSEDGRDATCVE